ncbi:MAG: RNA polymerase sigma factor [Jatrophihabitantaceae bacterium]
MQDLQPLRGSDASNRCDHTTFLGYRMTPHEEERYRAFAESAWPRLVRAGVAMTSPAYRVDVEDAAQETLIVLFSKWSSLRDPDRAFTFAYRTMARKLGRSARKRRMEVPDDSAGTAQASTFETHVVEKAAVFAALATLPRNQREALAYRYVADLGLAEIATILGRKESTIKSDLYRGMAKLRAALENAGTPTRNDNPVFGPKLGG